MSRRLLGPIGGAIAFGLVALLVFSGLGWVTYSALQVEQAQREAAARAEQGANLREALWRLDGRMLPTLGVEGSRPFYQYAPPDPTTVAGAAATPLLAATLPAWMKLHFQLDPTRGWESPQVLDPTLTERIRQVWPDLDLRNFDDERVQVLADLRANFPVLPTCAQFAQGEDPALPGVSAPGSSFGTNPGNPAAAEVATVGPSVSKPPPATDPISKAISDRPTLGLKLWSYELCLPTEPLATNKPAPSQVQTTDAENSGISTGLNPTTANSLPLTNRVGRAPQFEMQNYLPRNDWLKRAETTDKALREARQTGDFAYPRGQLNPDFSNPVASNFAGFGGLPSDTHVANSLNPQSRFPREILPMDLGGVLGLLPNPGGLNQGVEADGGKRFLQNMAPAAQLPGTVASGLAAVVGPASLIENRGGVRPASQAEHRGASQLAPTAPLGLPPGPPPENFPPLIALHLGSMRPLWVTAANGADMLVLVRTVRFTTKTVYQGVVLDWAKLEAVLKDEVKDLFPEAKLVPIKDTTAVPLDRAMTALPIQLDPGSEQPLPPAGWTPLRIGLVLAWILALIAVTAVGLSGWSLIDLAERRMKFVSAVTHELRTPLTSLRLYLDLLISGLIQDEAKRRDYLQTLAQESDRLHRLVDNVLDFAKLEKRRLQGDIQPIRVGDLLEQIRATWTDRVAQDHKELLVCSLLPPEQQVATDAGMVLQIVGNLIDNAKKYTREATDPRIWVWARAGSGTGVVIEVEDRGPGVPANERRTIFQPFRRGRQADSKAGGAGLGLALAKSWAEVLGGRLTYRPAEGGCGSCFRLELPGV
jgi:signal transduction histidine kinase